MSTGDTNKKYDEDTIAAAYAAWDQPAQAGQKAVQPLFWDNDEHTRPRVGGKTRDEFRSYRMKSSHRKGAGHDANFEDFGSSPDDSSPGAMPARLNLYSRFTQRIDLCEHCTEPLWVKQSNPCEFPSQPFEHCSCNGCKTTLRRKGGVRKFCSVQCRKAAKNARRRNPGTVRASATKASLVDVVPAEVLAIEAAGAALRPVEYDWLVGLTEALTPLMFKTAHSLGWTSYSLVGVIDLGFLNNNCDFDHILDDLGPKRADGGPYLEEGLGKPSALSHTRGNPCVQKQPTDTERI